MAFSQLSKIHYIPPITESGTSSSLPQDHYIYISTPSTTLVNFTIKIPGSGATISGTVSKTAPYIYTIGIGRNTTMFVNITETSTVKTDKGFIIEAQSPVYVSVRSNAGAQAGALVSKGLSALGTTFRVGSFTNASPGTDYLNFVSVMATEDNTQVTFSDLPTGLTIVNYTGTLPITVNLNKGEGYIVATNSNSSTINRDGLIGCLVNSNKPIVVNCGSSNGSFHNGTGRDYGIDQIVGLDKVGTEYILVKGGGLDGWENVLIVAHTDNTEIQVNGVATPVAIINAGDYHLIEGNLYNSNMYVQTSAPVFTYQGVGATNSEANQGLFFVPPLSCETRGNLDYIAAIQNIGNTIYTGGITIVTKATATITINNLPLSSFSTSGPNAVTGKPDYVTYKVLDLNGNVSVQSDDELYCAYFNFNGAATSGSFYSGFAAAPEINFNTQLAALGNCIPNITLEGANTQNFDSFEWWFDDGTGFQNLSIATPSFKPINPGKYKLIGIIACTGVRLESVEIPVSICPDDVDNDGIIDNLDIDNDNDGILNCTESRGDVVLNLSNTNQPILQFQDGTTNTTIATNSINLNRVGAGTNTLGLDALGNFSSDIPSDSDAGNIYSLNFTEAVNIKLSEATTIINTAVEGEEYIVRILPFNKNITLSDPDNRLLVDSNFDGIFEAGITQISGSEIRFKINPTPSGIAPYTFTANKIDSFSFIHRLQNIAAGSNFTGLLSLTCFKKDSDLDGIEDALDLDSDNDGIPDFIENQGFLPLLSGIDADLNGLDDVYDINATPVDSDSDGIYDFYDLDSDNDGIYDLEESGSNLPDADLDGVIDAISTKIGTNGWDDNAEITPDSNTMGYTLNNVDADNLLSYRDLDSDGDGCSDVIEAGFKDGNNDNLLGNTTVTVDAKGIVTNATDGYTVPNNDYLTMATITITTQPVNTNVCELEDTTISLVATPFSTIQWEISTDGITWNTIIDDATYSNSQTASLTISNTSASLNGYQYRAFLNIAGNSCGYYSNEVTLTIFDLPIVNNPTTYSQCDDASNDGQAFFNLELNGIKEEINPNYVAESLTFFYFKDETEAINKGLAIPNPSNYQDALGFAPETIYIRVENPNGCFRVVPLTLVVSLSSSALDTYNPIAIHQCDDGTDVKDGVSTFDLSNIKNDINNIFTVGNVTIHFYESQQEAELETNEITDVANHQNTNSPNAQDIWVRVKSDLGNSCLGLKEFQNLLIVEALPTANFVSNLIECDNDNNINDGRFAFDTSQIENTILGGQSLTNVNINYSFLALDGVTVINQNTLPNPLFTFSQTVTVRVTNNVTQDADGACFDETIFNFVVDTQPIANAVPPQIVCDGSAGDIDDDGLYSFNTSTFNTTILGSQTGMEIYYDYIAENGNAITNSTTLPNPLISENQTITVTVINPDNTNCSATTSINLIVNPLPDFSVESPLKVCTSDPTFSVILDPIEANITENFSYNWFFENGTMPISNAPTLTITTPGTYTITLTKTDGTNCSRSRKIVVEASEKATITQDDVTIVDISENNSVTINTTNLGNGTYEFALAEVGSSLINYQTEPIFNNVKAGFYTIFVQDDLCGISTLDISVIGYTKFFTPNGDGFNDYWQIKGINTNVQSKSIIYIFDRYGKLLKELKPNSMGWDGTFNGQLLPTSDYWFKVTLEDGRNFSGHFTLKR